MKKSKSVNKGFSSVPNTDEKPRHKKQKLADTLGPRWSKLELELFYQAYRKYNKDWKKVASSVRSRSIEMVEALYKMNRAYLSLPDGTVSVVGLIAMMTDHYNVNGGCSGERENDESTMVSRKVPKPSKAKVQVGLVKENHDQSQSVGSSHRSQSFSKVDFGAISQKVPVKKRTARIPVSSLDIYPNKKPRRSYVPEATHGERELDKPLQNLAGVKGHLQFLEEKATNSCVSVNEESVDGSLGSNAIKNGDCVRDSVDSVISASSDFKRGSKKGEKEEIAHAKAKFFNSAKQSYNFDSDFEGARTHKSTSEVPRKRSTELRFEDERVACEALQILAGMSEMKPFLADNPAEDVGNPISKNACSDLTVRDEGKKEYKKKHIAEASKLVQIEGHIDHCVKPAETETLTDKEVTPASSNGHVSTISRSCESSTKFSDVSSTIDRPSEQVDVAVCSSQVHPASQVVNLTKRTTNRKRNRTLLQIDGYSAPSDCRDECMSSTQTRMQCLKKKVSCCLSWHDVRRWCIYEWFYSAIDYPWFAKREFVEYLEHLGLGCVQRLTRGEWVVIRSSLGKPRRFSQRFLQEEREKLKQHRESVRTHYANLRAGHGGHPTNLAWPISVGQQVVAIHPKTRDVHNGSILAVDHQNFLVQFDSPDLGVELVMDTDCMPLHPEESMPEALRREKMSVDSQYSHRPSTNGPSMVALQENMNELVSDLYISSFNPSITNGVKPVSVSLAPITDNGNLGTLPVTQSHYTMAHKYCLSPIPGLKQILHGKGLEQHNPVCFLQPAVKPTGLNRTIHSLNSSTYSCQDMSSSVAEAVEGSRDAAQRMVDIAIEVITSIKEGDNAFARIREALDTPNHKPTVVKPSNTVQTLPHQLAGDASGTRFANGSTASDIKVRSNLITSCVATLLMIQACTERKFPPAEVAQIIENAVTSLRPCCSQNLSIYREIQTCMGQIKFQILGLVPT